MTAYLAYVPGPTDLYITRQIAGEFDTDVQMLIEPPLDVGTWYRLRLRVTGTDPVELWAAVEEDDTMGGWMIRTEFAMIDTDAARIAASGSFGASGDNLFDEFEYDNFRVLAL